MNKRIVPWFFLAVPLFLYGFFVIGTLAYSFCLSFTDASVSSTAFNFVGLANYVRLFGDKIFYKTLRNNLIWAGLFPGVSVLLGLTLAILVDSKIKGEIFFKSIFYLPMILSLTVVGFIWTWIYDPRVGILNATLKALGLDFLTRTWIGDYKTVLYSIIVAASWRQAAFCMILFLAGLRNIPVQLVEEPLLWITAKLKRC